MTKMLVEIRRESICKFGDELQFDLKFPEYPELPTYGIRTKYPITLAELKKAIKDKAIKVKAQMEANELVRDEFAEDIASFSVDV